MPETENALEKKAVLNRPITASNVWGGAHQVMTVTAYVRTFAISIRL